MRLLLDTNVLLWALIAPGRLSGAVVDAISDGENRVYVSIVSPWEISIKAARGKLPSLGDLEAVLAEKRFDLLPVRLRHARAIEALPHHHRDPFDRMLIAQAQIEGLTLVTSDDELHSYQVALMPAI